jgi:murein DD-endopeptidase MepM/ murein hydrolase activator NlpD
MRKLFALVIGLLITTQTSCANDTASSVPELKSQEITIKTKTVKTTEVETKNPTETKEVKEIVVTSPVENEIIVQPEESKRMTLDSNTKKQGEFFQVVIRGLKEKPTIWFNAKSYPVFEIPDTTQWNFISGENQNHLYRALIPVENLTKPGTYSVLARADGFEAREQVVIEDNMKPISKITLSSSKSTIYATQKELDIVGTSLKKLSDKKLWSGKFIYPSNAPKSSPFGVKRSYNGGPADSYHKGLDFAANKGAPVVAPADGKVVAVGKADDGFNVHGNTIILDHGHGVTSIYMHLSKINVTKAQDVKVGEKIGEVGHTGISTGPHLHWGVYLSGVSTDPELFVNNSIL